MKFQKIESIKIINALILIILGICVAYPYGYQDSLQLDSSIRYGKLKNGLTYYIKPIENRSSKIEIRLLIKAGKAQVDEGQYELEHFLEHVAFKAGKHMNIGKATDLGFEIGQINGNTSFDFTQYIFKSVKTVKEREIAFLMFQDIIWNLDFKDNYIDSERSVIINETAKRGGFNSSSIMRDLESSMIGRGGNRPENFVHHINSFAYETLKRYYTDWYRPDLIAVVVAGDIDNVDSIENEIKEKFSRTKPNKNLRSPIKNYKEYRNSSPQFIIKKHPYSSNDSNDDAVNIFLYIRQKENREEHGIEVLESEQKKQLFIRMLKRRLDEQYHQMYTTPFHVNPEFSWNRPSLGLKIHVRIENGSAKKAIVKSLKFVEQLLNNGASEKEFLQAKSEHLASVCKQDTTKVNFWIDNIKEHFIYREILPSTKTSIVKNMVQEMTLEDLNQYMATYLNNKIEEVDIIMLAPESHYALSHTEKEIRGWIKDADELRIEKYIEPSSPSELLSLNTPLGLKNVTYQRKSTKVQGASEYILSNGVRIVLKPNDSLSIKKEKNQLRFRGFSHVGVGCFSKSDYYSALNAAKIIDNSGVGGMDKFELKRYLNKKEFTGQIVPYISYHEAGIRGSISLSELETALQLVYLYFSAPNKDSLAFEDWRLDATSSLAKKHMYQETLNSTIREEIGDYSLFPITHNTLYGVSKTNLNRAFEIYQDIYGKPENFTFIFTGDFNERKVLALCQKYLGNLVVNKKAKKCALSKNSENNSIPPPKLIKIQYPEPRQQVTVELGYISKINIEGVSWKEQIKLELFRSLLNFSLQQKMRNKSDEGGLYSIRSWINLEESRKYNEVFIGFSSSQEDVNRLVKQVKKIIISFKSTPLDKALLDKYIQEKITFFQKSPERRIPNKIYKYYRFKNHWVNPIQEQQYLKSITPEDINILADQVLKEKPFEFKIVSSKGTQ